MEIRFNIFLFHALYFMEVAYICNMEIFKDLYNLFSHPQEIKPIVSLKDGISVFGKAILIYLLLLTLYIPISILILFFRKIGFELPPYGGGSMQNIVSIYGQYAFCVLVIIGPLFEELMFRLPLIIKRSNLITASFCGIVYCCFQFLFGWSFLFFILTLVLLICLIIAVTLNESKINSFRIHYTKHVFYCSNIIFLLLHLSNFAFLEIRTLFICILNLLPVLFLSICASYLRFKAGFIYGVIWHCGINFLFYLVHS
ncbi:hypothetical protein D0T85_05415 [Bacteroides sp. 519]|nr:hypothetical protein [Bacteroides sp. 519]